METCIAPGVSHQVEFVVASFGTQVFQCILCKMYFDEAEDCVGG